MELTRAFVADVTDGRLRGPEGATEPVGVGAAFDSRVLTPGEVFFAIRDARDGHDFVASALARGAAFAVVERPVDDALVVEVDDSRRALTRVALAARARLRARTVGITGSVGKTSTKDLTAAAVGAGLRTYAAPQSFNNEIGVPVTLLGAREDDDAVIVEMGARFAGNIAELCTIAKPEIGVITNIGLSHAEHLGGPEGVARVKGELLDALPPHGLAIVASDCVGSAKQRHRSVAPVLTVGPDSFADVRVGPVALDDELRARFRLDTPWGGGAILVGLRGAHQAMNAAQAAAVALHLGVPFAGIADALAAARGSSWRMELLGSAAGVRVLNDAYNASPASMLSSIDALVALPAAGRRVAVLGEMLELGDRSTAEHAKLGALCAERGVDVVVAVGAPAGPLAAAARAGGVEVFEVADAEEAMAWVRAAVAPGDVVLVKASRNIGLEVVADALVAMDAVA